MFTGIVEAVGIVAGVTPLDRGIHLAIQVSDGPGIMAGAPVGGSVCVSGVCLTVVGAGRDSLEFEVVEETLQRSTLRDLQARDQLNLEKPVSLNTLLGGHLVQGHVDAVGVVQDVERRGLERWITIGAPENVLRYVVEKGSIAVDGVSLTVAAVDAFSFSVAIIPHTANVTTLGLCRSGSRVNLEVDILAKHLEKLAAPHLQLERSNAICSH
ncbi:MAG TPA: riboflavin synthase [Armatimonadota bacterium]|nr:riboflavin synthase [Armatimonadota bacterium]